MALKSNRVGVRTDQVDEYGRVISKSFFQSLIDHLPRWTSLKVWKNGTEQLLPVNTDEPVTSPIVADIQYPTDSSATEQMFTYRESPTDADGEAYIQSIKGNTIVWNQLATENTASGWVAEGVTKTVDGNEITITSSTDASSPKWYRYSRPRTADHVYYVTCFGKTNDSTEYSVGIFDANGTSIATSGYKTNTSYEPVGVLGKCANSTNTIGFRLRNATLTGGNSTFKNMMLFDLTVMFGSNKADEIYAMETAQVGSGVAYFRSLFPLSYYQYDEGSLLSFNGSGIKTTGKNLFNYNDISNILIATTNRRNGVFFYKEGTYTVSSQKATGFLYARVFNADGSTKQTYFVVSSTTITNATFTISNGEYFAVYDAQEATIAVSKGRFEAWKCQVEFGSTPSSYEPYATSTTTIPTDTYFPTGMKSAGTVYDEFVSSRAYTRIGEVDLGSLTWGYNSSYGMYSLGLANLVKKPSADNVKANAICPIRTLSDFTSVFSGGTSSGLFGINKNGTLGISTTETDATAFKTAMDGVMLQYELAEEIIEPTLEFDEE